MQHSLPCKVIPFVMCLFFHVRIFIIMMVGFLIINLFKCYDIPETGSWSVYDTPTDIIPPTYGHSSVYDPVKKLIYIHGGFASYDSQDEPSTELTVYNPITRVW